MDINTQTLVGPTEVAVERRCPRCAKRLARLNPGPTCYACEPEERAEPRRRTRVRRTRLPHGQIIDLYREIGDTTKVAKQLGLPRSSVWYAIHRAKQDGRLPETL
ncbi:MAG: hypothetical protein QOK40_3204 [Miltoncostaeaceae bacterium]|nr:hypothetical protein [Miltoncostaeaceae bacterium]